MSLTSALISSQYGIRKAQNQLNVSAANIANADRDGYTRKSYLETGYVSINGTTIGYRDTIERATNSFLTNAVVRQSEEFNYARITDQYLANYDRAMGSTGGQSTLNAALDDLVDAVGILTQTPENESEKAAVVNMGDQLAYELRSHSRAIQQLRLDAEQQLDTTVDRANTLLRDIHNLNEAILAERARGNPTADLEDNRATALRDLAGIMDIQFHETSQGRIQIYTNAGQLLLASDFQELTFTPSATINSQTTYPGTLSGVRLNGIDITERIKGGEMGALIDIRDDVMVREQAKLDELATELIETMNRIHNAGASVPGPDLLLTDTGFAGGNSLVGSTGIVRVAAINGEGTVIEFRDINMATPPTIDAFILLIDTMANLAARRTLPENEIEITAPATDIGIAFVEMTPVNMLGSGQNFGEFFGFNNFFTHESTGAENIRVRDTLLDSPTHLSTGTLNNTPTPPTILGTVGVAAGDNSSIEALNTAFDSTNIFDAVGGVADHNVTFQDYVSIITSSTAVIIENAASAAENAQLEYEIAKGALENFVGVNVDEELTNITVIENAYASSAQVMSTIQDMFEALLQAIR